MHKKCFIKLIIMALLLSIYVLPAYAATSFSDVNDSYAKDAIQQLMEAGIINGTGDGKFDPTGKIKREDFAIILSKALGLDTSAGPSAPTFSDVPQNHYAYAFIEAVAAAKLVNGIGYGQFGTGQNLSRQDMAVLFVRALGMDVQGKGSGLTFTDKDSISNYAKDAVAGAVEFGLIGGNPDGTFNPTGHAERQSVALVASKFLQFYENHKNQDASSAQSDEIEEAQKENNSEKQISQEPRPMPNPSPDPYPTPDPDPIPEPVDTTPPELIIISPRDAVLNNTGNVDIVIQTEQNATVTVSVYGNSRVLASVIGAGIGTDVTLRATGLEEGEHRLVVKAKDAAGNETIKPIHPTIIVDKTPPTIFSIACDTCKTDEVTLHVEAEDHADVEIIMDNQVIARGIGLGEYQPFRFDLPILAVGAHTITVKAIDKAGNETIIDYELIID